VYVYRQMCVCSRLTLGELKVSETMAFNTISIRTSVELQVSDRRS